MIKMPATPPDFSFASHHVAPAVTKPFSFGRLIGRLAGAWIAAERRRRDAEQLATMPDYLLYDIGLTRDGVASLARQLRSGDEL
jgi:uncharacterized protein YjiS (DUF1127 family)